MHYLVTIKMQYATDLINIIKRLSFSKSNNIGYCYRSFNIVSSLVLLLEHLEIVIWLEMIDHIKRGFDSYNRSNLM